MLTTLLLYLGTSHSIAGEHSISGVPVFYISLNHSAAGRARSARLQSSFSAFAQHVELVPGVDGNASARTFVHAEQHFHHLMRRNTASEMGCSLSHVVAIQRAEEHCIATGCEMAIILEDDVNGELLPYWNVPIVKVAASMPDNWAVLQLQLIAQEREWKGLIMEWRARPALTTPHDRRLHFGTGAYLIHRRGMRQILAAFTVHSTPLGAAALAGVVGGASVSRSLRPPGALAFPIDMDEIQADVHLIYSLASPTFLATPPLLSCSHSTSSIEHHSAIRLTAQNAAKENDRAHEISELLARQWVVEAAERARLSTGRQSLHIIGPAQQRVVSPSLGSEDWAHHYCSNLDVRGVHLAKPTQVHLLVAWLDGYDFQVRFRRGHLQIQLSVHVDATASVGYPTYRLSSSTVDAMAHGAGRGGASEVQGDITNEGGRDKQGESAVGRRLAPSGNRRQKRAKSQKKLRGHGNPSPSTVSSQSGATEGEASLTGDTGQHVGKYGEIGWKRLPLVRGGLSRLTMRLDLGGLELYCEGVLLESQTWTNVTGGKSSQLGNDEAAGPGSRSSFHMSMLISKPTKLFFAWSVCSEAAKRAEESRPRIAHGGDGEAHVCLTHKATGDDHTRRGAPRFGHECVADLSPTYSIRASKASKDSPTYSIRASKASKDSGRGKTFGLSATSRVLEWRSALQLKVTSHPLLLPAHDPSLLQPRFIRYRKARCGNEVKIDPNAITSFQPQIMTPGSSANRGYAILGPQILRVAPPPPPPPPSTSTVDSDCAQQCSSRAMCIGYRVDKRRGSATQCVLIKAMRSKRAADCDLVKLRRQLMLHPGAPNSMQSLSLAESSRALTKPYREATNFLSGDMLRVVGKRTQLSNVPTKILLSHVASPGEHSNKAAVLQQSRQQRASEVHLGFFIDWKRKRTWVNQYIDGSWGREQPIHGVGLSRSFPFRLGGLFSLNVTRMPTSIAIAAGGERVVSVEVGNDGAVHLHAPTRQVNQIVIQGSAVEHAVLLFAESRWRTLPGVMCANELFRLKDSNGGANYTSSSPTALSSQRRSWSECRTACAEAHEICSGFAHVELPLVPGTTNTDGRGLCRLQGFLKTKTISACEFRDAANWDLNLRLQKAPARWYNVAMVAPLAMGISARATNVVRGRQLLEDPLRGWLDSSVLGSGAQANLQTPKSSAVGAISGSIGRRLPGPSPLVLPLQRSFNSAVASGGAATATLPLPGDGRGSPAAMRNCSRRSRHHHCESRRGRQTRMVSDETGSKADAGRGVVRGSAADDHPHNERDGFAHGPGPSPAQGAPGNEAPDRTSSGVGQVARHIAMPCVLRESSYSYCGNPAVLTRGATDHLMENLYGAWWLGTCVREQGSTIGQRNADERATTTSLVVNHLTRLDVDSALTKLGLVPELATEDLVLFRYEDRLLALASLIEIKSWEASARRSNQRRRPFLFDVHHPSNGTALHCDNVAFNFWEKNWMPFVHEGRVLAVRWFSPHTVVEIFPESGTCTQLHAETHGFASGAELHGGTPPLRFDNDHYLTLVRLRTGSWVRSRETRNYVNLFYLFQAKPPFAVVRVSLPFTLPSCAQPRLHMLIQVAKSFVEVEHGYLLCWGELDCYSCCATLPRQLIEELLTLPTADDFSG